MSAGANAEPSVLVTCPSCGARRQVSASWARRNAKNGSTARCPDCKRGLHPSYSSRDVNWWLNHDRLSRAEVLGIAHAVCGGEDDLPTMLMKAASGNP